MKISSSKSSLLTGIQTVIRALPSKSTMSIMECILINTTGGKISLTVNNIDLGIETVIDGKIEKTGVIALDAKFLSEIIRKMLAGSSVAVLTCFALTVSAISTLTFAAFYAAVSDSYGNPGTGEGL